MSFTARRRHLSCFYCGQKSPHKFEAKAQQFYCEHCEAVNYLDKHGHITDPPVSSTSSVTSSFRFAHAPDRPTSPPPVEADDIFCQKCLKNQHLLKENLASYLPAEDDPSYDDYLDSYDGYRRKLEQRYPQVCATCAPKAKEKIKKASYAAKSDHLRRMMDKTRQSNRDNAQGLFSTVVLRIAGLGWATSAAAQACWHAMSAMSVPQAWSLDEYQESLYIEDPSAQQCAQQLLNEKRLHKACVMPLSSWMPYVLLLALCTVWWNNKLRYVLWRRNAVSGGVKELYVLQGTTFLGRVLSWYFLSSNTPRLVGDGLKAAHVFMVLFIIMTSILMLNTIKLDLAPKVNFTVDETAILGPIGDAATDPSGLASSHPLHRKDDIQAFPIDKLAPSTSNNNMYQQARQAPYKHATPSPERGGSDTDAMDWTPSTRSTLTSFNPPTARSNPNVSAAMSGPSPFHGGLPAAPQPPAHRLLKPAALQPGALRKVSDTQKDAFATAFSSFNVGSGSIRPTQYRDYDDETTATEDEGGLTRRVGKKRREMEIADPKFWPQSDFQKDTGLESMFGESFTMTDGPAGVRVRRGRGTNGEGATSLDSGVNAQGGKSWTSWVMLGAVPTACLGVAVLLVKGGVL